MNSDPTEGDDSRYRVIHYPGARPAPQDRVVGPDPIAPSLDAQRPPEERPVEDPLMPPAGARTPPERWSTRNKALAGVATAAVLGVGLGVLLMPEADRGRDDKALAAAAASRGPDQHLEIQVHNRPPPTQAVRVSGGKLDAASTVMAPAAGAPVASSVPDVQASAKPDRPGGVRGFLGRLFGGGDRNATADADASQAAASSPPARPVRVAEQAAPRPVQVQPRPAEDSGDEDGGASGPRPYAARPQAPPWAAQPRPQPAVQANFERTPAATPSFNCGAARRPSEVMICQVPALAAADRRMARAYADARRAGVPSDMLKAQQQRWYRARDRAAVSPQAVGMVYEQRIAELEQLRQQAGHTEDAGDDDW